MKENFGICCTSQGLPGSHFCYSPFHGGRITKLVLYEDGKPYAVLKELTEQNQSQPGELFTNAILVPFPNRLCNGRYQLNNQAYHIAPYPNIHPHAIHGLMYNQPADHVAEEHTDACCKVVLTSDYKKNDAGYPFDFTQTITYRLTGQSEFSCMVSVRNTGDVTIPVGIGIHPFIAFQTKIDDISMELPPCRLIETNEDGIPTGALTRYQKFQQPSLIQQERLNNCFLADVADGNIEIRFVTHQYKLIYYQDYAESKYFQLFTSPDRQTIAVEPMTCCIDAFNNHRGLQMLEPGEYCHCSYGIMIQ